MEEIRERKLEFQWCPWQNEGKIDELNQTILISVNLSAELKVCMNMTVGKTEDLEILQTQIKLKKGILKQKIL